MNTNGKMCAVSGRLWWSVSLLTIEINGPQHKGDQRPWTLIHSASLETISQPPGHYKNIHLNNVVLSSLYSIPFKNESLIFRIMFLENFASLFYVKPGLKIPYLWESLEAVTTANPEVKKKNTTTEQNLF